MSDNPVDTLFIFSGINADAQLTLARLLYEGGHNVIVHYHKQHEGCDITKCEYWQHESAD